MASEINCFNSGFFLHEAIERENEEEVANILKEYPLAAWINHPKTGISPMRVAIARAQPKIVALLLKTDPKTAFISQLGTTALHLAMVDFALHTFLKRKERLEVIINILEMCPKTIDMIDQSGLKPFQNRLISRELIDTIKQARKDKQVFGCMPLLVASLEPLALSEPSPIKRSFFHDSLYDFHLLKVIGQYL